MNTASLHSTNETVVPRTLLQLLELRAFYEYGATIALRPLWSLAASGDGHPVMVLPGLGAGDDSTRLLREFLVSRGYTAYPWAQGTNLGLRNGVMTRAFERVHNLAQRHGRKVSLIGWSLGGIYARALAARAPEVTRVVATLGAPISSLPPSNRRIGDAGIGGSRHGDPAATARQPWQPAPPVPTTSIWSRSDGVVPWQCSVETRHFEAENIEVFASHFGLGMNPAVLYALADRLAQPEGQWEPFHTIGLRRAFYGGDVAREA